MISSQRPCGRERPASWYCWQASVDTVNPGGTDSPMLDISARFAPLPPSSSFIVLLPSLLPLPKWNTLCEATH